MKKGQTFAGIRIKKIAVGPNGLTVICDDTVYKDPTPDRQVVTFTPVACLLILNSMVARYKEKGALEHQIDEETTMYFECTGKAKDVKIRIVRGSADYNIVFRGPWLKELIYGATSVVAEDLSTDVDYYIKEESRA